MPQNDVEELGKLPQLLAHFQYHQSPQGGALTLSQFLQAHYSLGGSTMQSCPPSAEHDKLPLHGQHRLPNLEYVIPGVRSLACSPALAWSTTRYCAARAPQYCNADGASLLQPPRA